MTPRCEIAFDAGPLRPGADVRGEVVVVEAGRLTALALEARYWERTKDGFDALAARHSTGCLLSGDLDVGERRPFALRLPGDALPAYRSATGELGWTLDVYVRIDDNENWKTLGPLAVGRPGVAQPR